MEQPTDESAETLQISAIDTGEEIRVTVAGELDIAGVEKLDAQINEFLASGKRTELDITGLTFIDSTGLSVLVRQSLASAQGDGRFRVLQGELATQVQRLIDTTGTAQVLWP